MKPRSRLCEVIIRFEKETIGRGPEEVKAYLVDDLVLLREKGILTQAEKSLIGQEEGDGGRELVREFRRLLLEGRRERLEEEIGEVLGREVKAMFADLDIERDERLIILVILGQMREREEEKLTVRSRISLIVSVILLLGAAFALVFHYVGVEHETVLTYDEITSLPAVSATYHSINNWATVEDTDVTGVPLYQVLEKAGVTDGGAQVEVIASDGYFWPAVGDVMDLDELRTPNPQGLYPLLAWEMNGETLQPEPDGSGPLRLVMPQYAEDEVNKPSWVSNVRLSSRWGRSRRVTRRLTSDRCRWTRYGFTGMFPPRTPSHSGRSYWWGSSAC